MISMKINLFSNILHMNMDLRLLLPADKSKPTNKASEKSPDGSLTGKSLNKTSEKAVQYPVLWLCHGGSGNENAWLYYSTVASLVDKEQIAMVIVNADNSCFVDMAMGPAYQSYLGKELPHLLPLIFPELSTKREENMVCGLSNGGYGCFLLGMTYPENFGYIGAFSAGDKADASYIPAKEGEVTQRIRMFGSDDINGTVYSMREMAKEISESAGPFPKVYHACGSEDPWLNLNLKVKQCMEELDCEKFEYKYDQIENIGHEWAFWDEEVRRFLN